MKNTNRPPHMTTPATLTKVHYPPADTADTDTTPSLGRNLRLCRRTPWQPMPLDVFPPVLRDFIESTARVKDIDPAFVALPVLAVLSAAVGNARRVQLQNDYCPPAVLWLVTVAESGDGKSPAMDAAMKPLVTEQARLAVEHAAASAAYAAARRMWLATAKDAGGGEPTAPQPFADVYIGDATTEAVAAVLADNPRGTLCATDEFAGLIKGFNSYKAGGNDREAWLSMYDARAVKINRKSGERKVLFIPRAFVAVCGTIQPAVLRSALGGDMVDCGFAARLLLAMPPGRRRRWCNDDVPAANRDNYAAVVLRLRQLPFSGTPELIHPTEAAMKLWVGLFDETEAARVDTADAGLRALLPKARDAAVRLALVLHCCAAASDTPGAYADRLDESSMKAGVTLARWFIYEARRVYDMIAGSDAGPAGKLRDWIERRGGSATVRDVMRSMDREYPNAAAAEQGLAKLVNAGLCEWQYDPTGNKGGRPVKRIVLQPPPIADTMPADTDKTPDSDAAGHVVSVSAMSAGDDARTNEGNSDAA